MSKYRGLYTFDIENHKYVTLPQTDGIIDLLDTDDYVSAEPLIKDEKVRKAVRAWAEANDYKNVIVGRGFVGEVNRNNIQIQFNDRDIVEIQNLGIHTIAELCGEEED